MQLLLQADRVRGDDDAAARLASCRLVSAGGGQDGRHEVGEALADAGARLDDQVLAARDGVGHGLGHRQLLGPVLDGP